MTALPDTVRLLGVDVPRGEGSQADSWRAWIQSAGVRLEVFRSPLTGQDRWNACVSVLRDDGTWATHDVLSRPSPQAAADALTERVSRFVAGINALGAGAKA